MLIRMYEASDDVFLEEMLFEAFFWKDDAMRPALSCFREEPEFAKVFAGWGRHGDAALLALSSHGEKLGAAWYRLWTSEDHSYGFVRPDVPEIGIGVAAPHRSKGVGRALLRCLVETARGDGFSALSLSVSPDNRAKLLYEEEGFRRVGESGTSWTMLLDPVPQP